MLNDREPYLASRVLGPGGLNDQVVAGPGASGMRDTGMSVGVPIAVALGTVTPLSFQRGMVSADAVAVGLGGGLALEDDSGLKACMDACDEKVKEVTTRAIEGEIICQRAIANAKSDEEKKAAKAMHEESQQRYKNDMAAIEEIRE